MRGPGTSRGYYRGNQFLYLVKCGNIVRRGGAQVEVDCGWTGYRAWPRWRACPWCGSCALDVG